MKNIYLSSSSMDDLLFLCAHDFRHDFLEDTTRSGRALGTIAQYRGGASRSGRRKRSRSGSGRRKRGRSGSRRGERSRSGSGRRKRSRRKSRSNIDYPDPENFPLICYVYYYLKEKGINFDEFCDQIENFTKHYQKEKLRIDEDMVSNMYPSFNPAQAQYSIGDDGVKIPPTINESSLPGDEPDDPGVSDMSVKGGSKTRSKRPTQPLKARKDKYKDKYKMIKKQSKPTKRNKKVGEPTRRSRRNVSRTSYIPLKVINPEKLKKWDDCLKLYKELQIISEDDISRMEEQVDTDQAIADLENYYLLYFVPSSEWERRQYLAENGNNNWKVLYNDWAELSGTHVGSDKTKINMMSNFNLIITKYNRKNPGNQFIDLGVVKVSHENWNKFKKFGELLINYWYSKIGNEKEIYREDGEELTIPKKDSDVWKRTKEYWNENFKVNVRDPGVKYVVSPPIKFRGRPGQLIFYEIENDHIDLINGGHIINNSASISKYNKIVSGHNPPLSKEILSHQDDRGRDKCSVTSIIDAQSNCPCCRVDASPILQDSAGQVDDVNNFECSIIEEGGDREIIMKINRVEGTMPLTYNCSISFQNPRLSRSILVNNNNSLSAYNIAKLFVDEFLSTGPSIDDAGWYSGPLALERIMSIFSLKLMGDFSQEVYSISYPSHGRPFYFFANDRVSVSRYLLLKNRGKYFDGFIRGRGSVGMKETKTIPGGGGYLSYSGRTIHHYMIITETDRQGGGGRKKVVRKGDTKNKRKVGKGKTKRRRRYK